MRETRVVRSCCAGSPRVETTHGMVALQASVHDGGVALLGNALLGHVGIDPIRIPPHFGTDETKLDGSRRVICYNLLERLVEFGVVEEDVGVVVPPVEVALDGLDGLDHPVQLLVASQDDKSGVGAWLAGVGLEAALDEDLVVLFADFSAKRKQGFSAPPGQGGSRE